MPHLLPNRGTLIAYFRALGKHSSKNTPGRRRILPKPNCKYQKLHKFLNTDVLLPNPISAYRSQESCKFPLWLGSRHSRSSVPLSEAAHSGRQKSQNIIYEVGAGGSKLELCFARGLSDGSPEPQALHNADRRAVEMSGSRSHEMDSRRFTEISAERKEHTLRYCQIYSQKNDQKLNSMTYVWPGTTIPTFVWDFAWHG
jgi:hypothetical protein